MTPSICGIVPTYNHHSRLAGVIDRLRQSGLPVIVIDDGSDNRSAPLIDSVCAQRRGTVLIRRDVNGGKGAAVVEGLRRAKELGFTHALQVDADGQHDLSVIEDMIETVRCQPSAVILGLPRFDDSMPTSRRIGRWLTHIWIYINTLSFDLVDGMCGLRIYPVAQTLDIVREENVGMAMDFDPEILVRLHWRGVRPIYIPVNVYYPDRNESNFRLWRDNVAISAMHTRLFLGMLRRLPKLSRQ